MTRFAVFGGSLLGCLAWAGIAEAADGRADFDLNNDGLIEINDLSDLNAIRNSPDGSSLYGSSAGCKTGG